MTALGTSLTYPINNENNSSNSITATIPIGISNYGTALGQYNVVFNVSLIHIVLNIGKLLQGHV